jgi:hypothetical protein
VYGMNACRSKNEKYLESRRVGMRDQSHALSLDTRGIVWQGIDEPDHLKFTDATSSPVLRPTYDLVIEAFFNPCWTSSAINERAARILS